MADEGGWRALIFLHRNSSYESVTCFAGLEANIHLKTNLG